MHELKNVGVEEGPASTFLSLFVQCSHASPLGHEKGNDCYACSSPSQTHERKGFSSASFPFGEVARSHARAERKKKRSVLSHLVSFATNGELDFEFRGVLIIGTRKGGGGLVSGRDL